MEKLIKQLYAVINQISCVLNSMALFLLIVMMMLTVVDVTLRYTINQPIAGALELVSLMLALIVALGLAYGTIQKCNVGISVIIDRFSPLVRIIINGITNLISLVFFIFVTWSAARFTISQYSNNATSGVLSLPKYPFILTTCVGVFMLSLVLLVNILKTLLDFRKEL